MNEKVKISFLIPIHNEGKILDKTLIHLSRLPYKNYEIIIGLDGCTDNSEEIVKKYEKSNKNFKYFVLNERKGKPAVIDKIIKRAKGEIIIINDADWLFTVKNKEHMKKFFSVFSNPKIGGIADSFTLEWSKKGRKSKSIGFLGEMWADKFWLDYQKKYFTYKKEGNLYIDKKKLKFPFLVNIFRKKLYTKNYTLADDFERCFDILDKGYEIILFEDEEMCRFVTAYEAISIKDLFRQKLRTALAREQLEKKYNFNIDKILYIKIFLYFLKNIYKIKSLRGNIGIFLWTNAMFISELKRKIKKSRISTAEGWKMRAKR